MIHESEKVEFKETYVDDIYKEAIAFANTEGGIIFIGVNDTGESIGIENLDDTYMRITPGYLLSARITGSNPPDD